MAGTAPEDRTRSTWQTTLVVGAGLWALAATTFAVTDNVIALPTVIILGSFLVPVVAVEWWWERGSRTDVRPMFLVRTFVASGAFGLVTAGALEVWLLPDRALPSVWVAVIEEALKLAILVVVTLRYVERRDPLDGILVGATIGFGFAAFESAGYALNAAIKDGSFDFRALVGNELLRGLEAPLLHGTWTGALGGALYAARMRIRPSVVVMFVLVVALHAAWDASSAAALALAVLIDGTPTQADLLSAGALPSPDEVSPWLYGSLQNVIQLVAGIAGVLLLRHLYRRQVARG
jgi:protease PrsW